MCNLDAFVFIHDNVDLGNQSRAAVIRPDGVDLLYLGGVGHGCMIVIKSVNDAHTQRGWDVEACRHASTGEELV